MKKIHRSDIDLIDAVIGERVQSSITPAVLEKDIHVTDALMAISKISHDHTKFVFCGGTSLSKSHHLIERMSEDLDIKIVISEDSGLNDSSLRKHLSALKEKINARMLEIGFSEDGAHREARNSNRFFKTGWNYEPVYTYDGSLRPHLSIELTARTPLYATVVKPIGYLVNKLAEVAEVSGSMECVSIEETMAEKTVSFLRRFAQDRAGASRQEWDAALVRHIYDVYCIHSRDGSAVVDAAKKFKELVDFDAKEFGSQFPPFAEDPVGILTDALSRAESDPQCISEYQQYLLPLIFGNVRPSYDEAFDAFKSCGRRLISSYHPHPGWRG